MSATTASEAAPPGLAAYRRVLLAPRILGLVASSTLANAPVGMAGLSLILYVHGTRGSFGAAGVVTGAFAIGLGATAPLLGRIVDRHGSAPVVLPGTLVCAASLAVVVLLGDAGAGTAWLAAAAFCAGAATPPTRAIMRHLWAELIPAADQPTAFACDAILIEVLFISGPLLAGGLAATVGAGTGLYVTAGIAAVGGALFARLGRVDAASGEEGERHWLGALTSPALRLLVFSGIPLGATFGVLDVVLPAFGAHHGASALGGPYAAALAAGSALGGIAFGANPHRLGPPATALIRLRLLMTACCVPLVFAASIVEMFFLAALAGLCIAPAITVRNQLVGTASPAGTLAESYTWMTLAITVGASLGSAVAGPLVQANGWRAGAILAVALPAAGAVVVIARRALLEPAPA